VSDQRLVNSLRNIRTAVAHDECAIVEVGSLKSRGEHGAARRDSQQRDVAPIGCAQQDFEIGAGKSADATLGHDEITVLDAQPRMECTARI